jgi:hypothetical protein
MRDESVRHVKRRQRRQPRTQRTHLGSGHRIYPAHTHLGSGLRLGLCCESCGSLLSGRQLALDARCEGGEVGVALLLRLEALATALQQRQRAAAAAAVTHAPHLCPSPLQRRTCFS